MNEKLDPFLELITSGEVPDEKLAELAGVNVADVMAYRAALGPTPSSTSAETAPKPSSKKSAEAPSKSVSKKSEPDERAERKSERDERILELARAAYELIEDHGFRLVDGHLVAPGVVKVAPERPRRLTIRLHQPLPAKNVLPNGRVVDHTFPPSIYRDGMAEKVIDAAKGNTSLYEVL